VWSIHYYNDGVAQTVLGLPDGLAARYVHVTDRMRSHGPHLGMPHTRAMGGGLFEIRLKSQEGIARVMYATQVGQRIVMLHAFVKKTDKTPVKELVLARQRLKEIQR
jgi:phage-related protein